MAKGKRDDFPLEVKDVLAKRVGMRCSNPNCRKLTCGPRENPKKAVNIGVAAHITAASKHGPRYDKSLGAKERKAIENGIWLCQNCGKLVDNDEERYTVDILRQWKRHSEEGARLAVETTCAPAAQSPPADIDLIRFYAQCFDRPAFQDHFQQEGSTEAFDKAIEDTITALNTGCLRARDGAVLARAKGKAYLNRLEWRQQMDVIVDLLRAIRERYRLAKKSGGIQSHVHSMSDEWYCIHDSDVAEWMDATRAQVLGLFSGICREAGLPELRFPRRFRRRW